MRCAMIRYEIKQNYTNSKLLDTVRIVSLQSAHVSRLFTVITKLPRNIINIKLSSNAIA